MKKLILTITIISMIFLLGACESGGSKKSDTDTCKHSKTYTFEQAATCTEDGYTVEKCSDCDEELKDRIVIPAGHKYVNGTCSVCGAKDPNYVPSYELPEDEL